MSQAWKRRWFVLLIWLFAGVITGGQSWYFRVAAGREAPWDTILITSSTFALLWFLLTPVIVWLSTRFHIERTRWPARIGLHILFALITAFVQLTAFNLIALFAQNAEITFARVSQLVVSNFDYGLLVYFVILLVHHAWHYYERMQAEQVRSAQLQAELAQAQLQALKMQLHPHFLFNTLNTIAVLIHENPEAAGRVLELLSDLLRRSLKNAGVQEVALQHELEFLKTYLEIEQTRFGERMSVRMNVAPETLTASVPNLILQPLVENAVRHGIAKRRGPGWIEISAARENGALLLRVRDNGLGLEGNAASQNGGIGLANTRARLHTLYGERGALKLSALPEGGAQAEITLPFVEVRP